MKHLIVVIAIVIFWLDFSSGEIIEKQQLIRVDVSDLSEETLVQFLRLQPDITSVNPRRATLDILAGSEALARFKSRGIPVEVLIDDIDAYEQTLRNQNYLDHFHTYDQMLQEMEQVAAEHPDIAKLIDIGDSWEKTEGISGRDIWAIKISDNVDVEEPHEAEVLYNGCHHAREIITPEIVLYFMHYLVDGYGRDPEVTFLVDNRQLWLLPMVNPDGHAYVFERSLWWRKNRRDNGDGSYGVDLNRNYGYMWGYDDIGSSPHADALTYRGPAPFSEPETRAIRDLTEAHTFVISLSYHSYGNLFLLPWGYVPENTPDHDDFVAIGDSATIFNGYLAGNNLMGTIYVTNGDTDDWMYGEQTTKYKVFGFTPEVGSDIDGFHPDTSRILPLIEENLWPNLYVARVAERYAPRPEIHHQMRGDTEDVSGPFELVIEISTPVYPLNENSPMVHFNTTGYPPFDSVSMIASADSGLFVGHVPGQGEDVTIYYFFSAQDSVPRTGYAPAGAPDSVYTFRVGTDMVPPVISHAPRVHRSIHALPARVQAQVTDNLGIGEVRLIYQVNGGALDSTLMSAQYGDLYVGHINWVSPRVGDYVSYRIAAIDRSSRSNQTVHPEHEAHYFLLLERLHFDFEVDAGGFTTEGNSDWEWGRPSSGPALAYSGEKVWGTRLHGLYSDLSDSRLDSPPVNLSGYAAATLTCFHWYRTESSFDRVLDGGNIKVSVDGGPFEVIFPDEGYDDIILPTEGNPLVGQPAYGGLAGSGDFWHTERFDLSPFVDHRVVLRFHFGSNTTATHPGWYIDDVSVQLAASRLPTFLNTTQLSDTDNATGPYTIFTAVIDDGSIDKSRLFYRSGSGLFESLDMVEIIPYLYKADIAGQPLGTMVLYYVSAEDDSGNVVTDPPGAPDSTYCFTVREQTRVGDAGESSPAAPARFCLDQNYPNPFNVHTDIRYQTIDSRLPFHTSLKIYNILGQEVRTLVNESQPAGMHSVTWDGRDHVNRELPTGIYLYRLESGSFREVRRMLLLK